MIDVTHEEIQQQWNRIYERSREEANVRHKGSHSKRNRNGHEFLWDGNGKSPEVDTMGVSQYCECGLKLYDWNCKWRWS